MCGAAIVVRSSDDLWWVFVEDHAVAVFRSQTPRRLTVSVVPVPSDVIVGWGRLTPRDQCRKPPGRSGQSTLGWLPGLIVKPGIRCVALDRLDPVDRRSLALVLAASGDHVPVTRNQAEREHPVLGPPQDEPRHPHDDLRTHDLQGHRERAAGENASRPALAGSACPTPPAGSGRPMPVGRRRRP